MGRDVEKFALGAATSVTPKLHPVFFLSFCFVFVLRAMTSHHGEVHAEASDGRSAEAIELE